MHELRLASVVRLLIVMPGILLCGGLAVRGDESAPTEIDRPKVWIYTDMSDPSLAGTNHRGTINDPDDVSAMAGYLLMANEFQTLGIVVASTHRKEHSRTPNQADWASKFFGSAYRADLPGLNKTLSGYPDEIEFQQSSIKTTAEQFDPTRRYENLDRYTTVASLLETVKLLNDGETINVLCWGSLTEPAILVRHCLANDKEAWLERVRFIAHWTNSSLHQGDAEHPERVANCREDALACTFLKDMAKQGKVRYHECGAIGQHGIVSGSPDGESYFDQFRSSKLGTRFVEGKFVRGRVDHSDSATYWVLLAAYGVSLNDIPSDGTNSPQVEADNESRFRAASTRIHSELLRRSKIASARQPHTDGT